jgi:peptide deformylase
MRTHAGIVNRNREVRVVINPETIIEAGEDVSTVNEKIEGCLSIPAGVTGWVTRCHEVRCVYWDENGCRHDESLKGMETRIYQHERDHLDGVLFVDRAEQFFRPEF